MDVYDILSLIIELLKVILWPFIVIFIIIRFGSDLNDYIKNVKNAKLKLPNGMMLDISSIQQKKNFNQPMKKDQHNLEKMLKFERIYSIIFKSQIDVLVYMKDTEQKK